MAADASAGGVGDNPGADPGSGEVAD